MIYYKNSILASVVSVFGCAVILYGLTQFSSGIENVIPFLMIGAPFVIGGKIISDNMEFEKWWEQVEDAKLIPEIKRSRDVAVEIYKKNPQKRTLEKIRKLNSDAAKYIENGFKEPKTNNAQQTVVQKTTTQQATTQQATAQQTTVQQTVAKQVVTQQPIVQQTAKSVSEQRFNVEEYIDRVEKVANANMDNPDVIWTCVQDLEKIYPQYPNHKKLQKQIGELSYLYAAMTNKTSGMPHQDSRRVIHAVQRTIELSGNCTQKDLDYRYAVLLSRAVHAGITASNGDDRAVMEEALGWLRVASRYRVSGVDDTMRTYYMRYNDAVACVRTWLCYWLAVENHETSPKNIAKAREYINEALHHCPPYPIRQCDLNPWIEDEKVILEKGHLLSRKQSIG